MGLENFRNVTQDPCDILYLPTGNDSTVAFNSSELMFSGHNWPRIIAICAVTHVTSMFLQWIKSNTTKNRKPANLILYDKGFFRCDL